MIGVLTPEEVEAILRRNRIGRLGCSADDHPYIVPINYVYDGRHVYAYSGPGRKVDVMRRQPRVAFEVDEIDNPSSWRCVMAEGLFEELTGEDDRRQALVRLTRNGTTQASGKALPPPDEAESALVPRSLEASDYLVLFRVKLTEKSGRFERQDG